METELISKITNEKKDLALVRCTTELVTKIDNFVWKLEGKKIRILQF